VKVKEEEACEELGGAGELKCENAVPEASEKGTRSDYFDVYGVQARAELVLQPPTPNARLSFQDEHVEELADPESDEEDEVPAPVEYGAAPVVKEEEEEELVDSKAVIENLCTPKRVKLKSSDDKMFEVDECMAVSINWSPDEELGVVNDYDFLTTLPNDVYIYLQTIAQTSQNILPPTAFYKVISGVLEHVSRRIVESFLSEDVKRFNIFAVMGIDADLRKLEDFADENYQSSVQDRVPEAQPLKSFLAKARPIVNLFLAT
jgi:hypothetical protein